MLLEWSSLASNAKKQSSEYSSNICFSSWVITEDTLLKAFTRRWFSLSGPQKFIASIQNTKLLKNNTSYSKKFAIEFINSNGGLLKRKCHIKANRNFFFDMSTDTELDKFFADQVWWCIVSSDSYLVDAYYCSTACEQIGGDNAF